MWLPTRLAFVLLAAAVVVAAGCSDEPRANEAQPVVEGQSFDRGTLDDLPRFPRSREVSEASEQAGATVQSFAVANATPDQVLAWYAEQLEADGWQVVEPPRALGASDMRGSWVKGGERLRVSAGPDPTLTDEDEDVVTQYSLVIQQTP